MVEPVFGRWGPTEVMERVLDGTWAEVVDGMALIEPASITYSGTSASISGLGSVEFEAVTSLSLNGVFSSLFDNYTLVVRSSGTATIAILGRMRSSGVDDSGSNYTLQQLSAQSTSVTGTRLTSQTSVAISRSNGSQRTGTTTFIYGPALAQPTAWRMLTADGESSGSILDAACTHSLSTAYDGLTLTTSSGTVTGRLAVYGMVK